MNKLATAAVAIGSNVGDRAAHLQFAFDRLRQLLRGCRISSVHETDPVEVAGTQPKFLNAAAVGGTSLSPRDLLSELLKIEQDRGRERPFPGAARTLDLDLILYGDSVVAEEGLSVPHPRFRDRLFVLEPLAEVAPFLTDPVTGTTVAELLQRLGG